MGFLLQWKERYVPNMCQGRNLFLFPIKLQVDIEFELFQSRLSTEREVVLDNVDFRTTGEYRCEVSGDAPMFQTASISGILFVVGKYKIIRAPCLDIVFGEP